MPSVSSWLPGHISLSHVQKFVPKKWKIGENNRTESMVDTLLKTLKEFACQGHLSEAFRTFSSFRSHTVASFSFDLTIQALSSLLVSSTNLKLLPEGKQLHAQAISLGLEEHPALVPKLITLYTSFDLLVDARTITEISNFLHPLPWNLLISSYVRNGLSKEAISTFQRILNKGIRPDKFTYPSILKACGEQLDVNYGKVVHSYIDGSSSEHNIFVQNALVSMYGKFGEIDAARKIFDKMPDKDTVSWNTIISGYASKGRWIEAFELFEDMRKDGAQINLLTWNTIAGGCLRTGNFKGTLELLSQMRTGGIPLDPVAVLIGLGACSHLGILRVGRQFHGLAVRSCYGSLDNVRNALITMYARCNNLMHAHVLFRLLEAKSVITWNSIISGYAHWDRSDEASFLFREMLLSGVEPNYVTIASILPLCARVADLQHGREFHCYIIKHEGFEDHLLLWNALVDTYARSGKVSTAKTLFYLLEKKDVITYTSLIAGYGIQGEGKEAIELFEEMIRSDIEPDHVAMVAVLSACSHSGLVVQGQILFEKMQTIYGLAPHLEHYACMVDLYGRAGLLKKAQEIITKMPYAPTSAMWATLIGACRIHGNTYMGEWAAEKLLEMKPQNSGYYVLIANMYAAAGSWTKLAKVRTFMRDLGVRKDPGCAWVDVGGGFSPFLVEDSSSSQTNEIYVLLGGLIKQMKDAGYVACADSTMEEEFLVE
ncbi:pentatricopeptide repeat-containing protein At1g71490 [Coffea arabica]|uniref:Pentatricopeptide repeat-containing protein At1g71490 n=1 Tax=Coffea arabica TaxID=13443 RepID=A0A6P6UKA6_COFAR|nr:pentatricopeptide repeat-containing protein At1g71490 [Coffea arabica]XP_027091285.1 pentatricopeptide repeat-containing protein At1g71490 [Coffea arabica]XP_027091286.1 pentatricopeptide repeat-containing protein At1g71490 [Coffea arabica]XP_027091287.1 pentatricopeptide repeat-containing protein At1g71490 [Coffea arabica]XP_027091288.1 pentatricopeptide repeat-containing protein At1g71490 [Coffea arabica]XP_027091289.1 pentatricopeptide repeat-containing protein At1g71490 [Coffea arabica]